MQDREIRPGDNTLEQALETVRASPDEARKFASDPEGYLKSKGVATDGLRVGTRQGELTNKELDTVTGGAGGPEAGICGSVGYIVCGSVGS